MNAAIVPVAFFTPQHVSMTAWFLNELHDEVDQIGVWHNGGTLAAEGWAMLEGWSGHVEDAGGWRFYRMWNRGVAWALEQNADVCLVLNNDITWPAGALRALAEGLRTAPDDVAMASPDPAADFAPGDLADIMATPAYRGLLGWCFAVRPWMWQQIDERYHTWYGDDELGLLMAEAGWRCVRASGVPVQHPQAETTMRYLPDVPALRLADQALYESKWA